MTYEDIILDFKKMLNERFSGGFNYIPHLASKLNVTERTIRRKLSGETEFRIQEIVTLARELDLPLSSLFNYGDSLLKYPMELYLHDFSGDGGYGKLVEKAMRAYKLAASSASSTYMVASNTLPEIVCQNHPYVAKFYYLKWLYYNKERSAAEGYSRNNITLDFKLQNEYFDIVKSFKKSMYIFNIYMMKLIADEIELFYDIRYISKEECGLLIADFMAALDELEKICAEGVMPGTNKEIDIYCSSILISNDMVLIDSDNLQLAIIYAYSLNPIVTKSKETFAMMLKWYHAFIRSANIISMSGSRQRYEFLAMQRSYLNKLREGIGV